MELINVAPGVYIGTTILENCQYLLKLNIYIYAHDLVILLIGVDPIKMCTYVYHTS